MDDKLLEMASRLLRVGYAATGIAPPRLCLLAKMACNLVLAATLVVIMAIAKSPGTMSFAAVFVALALWNFHTTKSKLGDVSPVWDARAYKRDGARWQKNREAQRGLRTFMTLYALGCSTWMSIVVANSGSEYFGMAFGVTVYTVGEAVARYMEAAEPPPPNDGDGFARAMPVAGSA